MPYRTKQSYSRVINLSSRPTVDFSFLEKGLNFIPHPTRHSVFFKSNIRRLLYGLQNRRSFYSVKFPSSEQFSLKSIPVSSVNENFLQANLDIINCRSLLDFNSNNLSVSETTLLENILSDRNIIIKPADKGGKIVILDRNDYIKEAERQLSNTKFYRKIDSPIFDATAKMISNWTLNMFRQKRITKETVDRLLCNNRNPRPRIFYLLPKIHKESWPLPNIPPGRPIVSDCSSESYESAKYIDVFLQPLVKKIPSFIRDSDHLISILSNTDFNPLHTILFTIDIESLYTCIPIIDGLRAVRSMFNLYPCKHRHDNSLLTLLEINLRRNDFVFNNNFYLQVCGTAMGKTFAPSYANIFLYFWEKHIDTLTHKPVLFKRYIDDILGVWEGSVKDLQEFCTFLNNIHVDINIVSTINIDTVNYLDLTIFKGSDFYSTGKLSTKVYFKPTHTGHLIHKHSLHSHNLKFSVIKAQFLRIARKCKFKYDFDLAINILCKTLHTQGYNFKQLRNIKYQVLYISGYYFTKTLSFGFHKCLLTNCTLCKYALNSPFVFDNEFNQFRILFYIDCKTSRVIFTVYCTICGPISVLYSHDTLEVTFNKIRLLIHSKPLHLISMHFNLPNHSIENFYIQGIDLMFNSNVGDKLISWIKKLNTFSFPGINTHIYVPSVIRLSLPYSNSNHILFNHIKTKIRNKFNVNIHSSFSSYPSFKKLLCKSKLN